MDITKLFADKMNLKRSYLSNPEFYTFRGNKVTVELFNDHFILVTVCFQDRYHQLQVDLLNPDSINRSCRFIRSSTFLPFTRYCIMATICIITLCFGLFIFVSILFDFVG